MGLAVVKKELTIGNKMGLHARPAAMLAQEASRFKAKLMVAKEDLEVNGKSIMGLMLLEAEGGSKVRITADGPDEKEAIEAISRLFARGFDEE